MSDVIPFRCPVCQTEKMAAKALAGRQARCPECGTLVTIPLGPPARSEDSKVDQSSETHHDISRGDVAKAMGWAEQSGEKSRFEGSEEDTDIFALPTPASPRQTGEESTFGDDRAFDNERTKSELEPVSEERTVADTDMFMKPSGLEPRGQAVETSSLANERPGTEDFDPYYRWLAIPKGEQPPNHYRLLGLQVFEGDPDVILNSSERQMAHVKAQAGGKYVVICQRLLSQLSLARICLLDEVKKAAYDADLRRSEAAKAGPPAASASAKKPAASPEKAPAARTETRTTLAAAATAAPLPTPLAPILPSSTGASFAAGEPAAPPVQTPWKGSPASTPSKPEPPAEEADEKVVVRRRVIEGEMDMTPMIDVTFLLLIFFICTASFALTMTKPIPAPKEDEPSTNAQTIEEFEDNPDFITVKIDAYNTFRVVTVDSEEETPSQQELIVKLRAVRQAGQDGEIPTTLMVIANGQALHQKVVQALDAGTEVGLEKLQLMVVESDE